MTRQEYDKIVDVFAFMCPQIEQNREENWEHYIEDNPKDLVIELSVKLGVMVLEGEVEGVPGVEELGMKTCHPFSRERVKHFAPEDLN